MVPTHSHHAIQIVVAIDGQVAIAGPDAMWRQSRGIIVRQDVQHSFDCNGALGVMVYVDPESSEGARLGASLRDDITNISAARLESAANELRVLVERAEETTDIPGIIRRAVSGLTPGPVPVRRFDDRVTTVIEAIRASDDLRFSLDRAADIACLSSTRFAHLFKEQVGLPFSRYMLWRKLTRAMVAISSEPTIAAAAQAADFSDAAHLTRTFYQMTGMSPSALMRGEFVELPSPFSAK